MKHWINSLFNRSTSGSLNPNYLKDVKFIYILYVGVLLSSDQRFIWNINPIYKLFAVLSMEPDQERLGALIRDKFDEF